MSGAINGFLFFHGFATTAPSTPRFSLLFLLLFCGWESTRNALEPTSVLVETASAVVEPTGAVLEPRHVVL